MHYNGVVLRFLMLVATLALVACGGGETTEDGVPIGETALDSSIGFVEATEFGWTIGTDGFVYSADAAYPVDFINSTDDEVVIQLFRTTSDHEPGAPPPAEATVVATVTVAAGETVVEAVPFLEEGDYLSHVERSVEPDGGLTSFFGALTFVPPE